MFPAGKVGLFSLKMREVHQLLICCKNYLGQGDNKINFRLIKVFEFITGLRVGYYSDY